MAVNVYRWPPVGVVGAEWTEDAPVSVSRSLFTGARFVSAAQRKRRLAAFTVSGIARDGAGYMEALKRLVAGGENLVRLYAYPVNWYLSPALNRAEPIDWVTGNADLEWLVNGAPLYWFTDTPPTGTVTTDNGFPALALTGCPPSTQIARAGEFATILRDDDTGETVQVLAPCFSDASGNATLRLIDTPTEGGLVALGAGATGAFEAVSIPRAMQPVSGDWTYTWEFREVFSDEVGGFTEVNPWA